MLERGEIRMLVLEGKTTGIAGLTRGVQKPLESAPTQSPAR